ncbi:Hypothetical predicted protein [Mytilus galloprovincialis]|uniref:Promethin n=1 Tax=Mytilus galloprovincialis TaxID=29158 RepID=A0A8B6FRX2_MYTGA|nr:Hypothetical predicted protein [Mytilus galloprovincialis]
MGGESTLEKEDGWIMTQLKVINDKLDVEENYGRAKEFATEHPVYTLFIALTIATCCIPVICFLTFLLGTIIFGVISFVFFEGTVLVISTVVLGGVLCVTTVLACSLSGFAVVSYYGLQYSYNLLKKTFPSVFETEESPDSTKK